MHSKKMQKVIEDSKGLVEVEKQKTKEVQLESITKIDAEIAYCNHELRKFREERQKFYEEIEMLQEIVNRKDKANKDLEKTME